jgi:hypothetical protein
METVTQPLRRETRKSYSAQELHLTRRAGSRSERYAKADTPPGCCCADA